MPCYYEGNKVHIQILLDPNLDFSEYVGELSKNHPGILKLLSSDCIAA